MSRVLFINSQWTIKLYLNTHFLFIIIKYDVVIYIYIYIYIYSLTR